MTRLTLKGGTLAGGNPTIEKRSPSDFYPTPPACTEALMRDFASIFGGKVLWEPACGNGAMSVILAKKARVVISSDLYDRGYGIKGVDFLTRRMPTKVEGIVTNPPFALAVDFIRKARTHNVPFAFLLKSTFWNAKKRHDLFVETGPLAVAPLLWRPSFAPSRGKSPTLDFCWTVWGAKPEKKCTFVLMKK